MQVADGDDGWTPPRGPHWSAAEAAELLRELHAAFDGLETPPAERLAKAQASHSDEAADIVRICAGRPWYELRPEDLLALYEFEFFISDEGFPVVIAALLHQALVAPGHPERLRSEFANRLVELLDPEQLLELGAGFSAETLRRIRAFPPAQLRVLRRFMELTQRQNTNPPWPESEGGRFWASLSVD